MLYVTSFNGKCMCAAFRPLKVTEEQANKCEYQVSGSVRFRLEQISAVTDSVPEQRRPDHMITTKHYITSLDSLFIGGYVELHLVIGLDFLTRKLDVLQTKRQEKCLATLFVGNTSHAVQQ